MRKIILLASAVFAANTYWINKSTWSDGRASPPMVYARLDTISTSPWIDSAALADTATSIRASIASGGLDSAHVSALIGDSLAANSRHWITSADSVRASHIADSAKVAGLADSAKRMWHNANAIPKGNGSTGLTASSWTDSASVLRTTTTDTLIAQNAQMGTWNPVSSGAFFGLKGTNNAVGQGMFIAGGVTHIENSVGSIYFLANTRQSTYSGAYGWDFSGPIQMDTFTVAGYLTNTASGQLGSTPTIPSSAISGAIDSARASHIADSAKVAGLSDSAKRTWHNSNSIPKGDGSTGLTASSWTDSATRTTTTDTLVAPKIYARGGLWSTGQLDIGTTSQGGSMAFRRGSNGTATGWLGFGSATTATDFQFLNLGGGLRSTVNAGDALLLDANKHAHFYGSLYSAGPDTIANLLSKTIIGTDAGGQIIDNSAATLTNNTTGSAAKWTTARNLTIGSSTQALDGTSALTFSLAAIGAQAAGSYQPLEDQRLSTTNSPTFTGLRAVGVGSGTIAAGPFLATFATGGTTTGWALQLGSSATWDIWKMTSGSWANLGNFSATTLTFPGFTATGSGTAISAPNGDISTGAFYRNTTIYTAPAGSFSLASATSNLVYCPNASTMTIPTSGIPTGTTFRVMVGTTSMATSTTGITVYGPWTGGTMNSQTEYLLTCVTSTLWFSK